MNAKRKVISLVVGLGLVALAQAAPALADTTPDTTAASHLSAFGLDPSGGLTAYQWKLSDIIVSSEAADLAVEPAARRSPWKAVCASCHGAADLPTTTVQ